MKTVYLHGAKLPRADQSRQLELRLLHHAAEAKGRQIQLDLFYDYHNNVTLYPKWQELLRKHQPPTIIFWGQHDIFFTREGGEAYLADLPKAEMHRLEAGHFAVEDCLAYISDHIHRFYHDVVARKR